MEPDVFAPRPPRDRASTLADSGRGQRKTLRANLDKVETVLTKAGAVFVSDPTQGEGVTLKQRPASRKARAARAASPAR